MKSKKSKSERKNDRIQALEKELASKKKKEDEHSITIRLDQTQVDEIMDQLTEKIEWSTNRIVDESANKTPIVIKPQKKDMFSSLIRWILSVVFFGFGVGLIAVLITNWSSYWIGGTNNISTLCVILIGLISITIGIDLFREKDRNYVISLFSALVALVALIVTLVK
ncbi:MAG: hypothetical protein J5563_06195 [Clostridia bacterium]|nr:hypothetical protein [Clostridia bacterium]